MQELKGFYPSTAGRWVPCPGSVQASQDYQDFYDRSEAADEGVAAHEVVELLHAKKPVKVGHIASNGFAISQEMIDGANLMLGVLPANAVLEEVLDFDHLHPGMKGRADAYAYSEDETILYIWDYKFGHMPVDPEENWQMILEAGRLAHTRGMEKVVMTVVQPRNFLSAPVRSWEVTIDELIKTYIPRVQAAVENATSDNPETNVGPQCAMCPARHACKALQESAMKVIDVSRGVSTLDLNPEATGRELAMLEEAAKHLKSRITGLQQQAIVHLRTGAPVRGYTLVPEEGPIKWTASPEQVFATADLMGIELRKPQEPITPTQAMNAGLSEKTVQAMSGRASKGPKLTKINQSKLKGVFKK